MLDIMTVKQAAEKWGVTVRRVQEMIREGKIQNLQRIGRSWVMPVDTQKPPDLRKMRTKKSDKNKGG